MQIKKISGFKKLGTLAVITMMSVLSVGTTAFAGSQYVSEEGVGVDVLSPIAGKIEARGVIEGDRTNVLNGGLWASWNSNGTFRANFDHRRQTHRATAQNANGVYNRSDWAKGGTYARSAYIRQTIIGNKVFADVK